MKKVLGILCAFTMILTTACAKGNAPVKPETIEPSYVDEYGDTIYPYGNTVDFKHWSIECESYMVTTKLKSTNNRYLTPDDGYVILLTNLNVTNNSDSDSQFIPLSTAMGGISPYLYPVEYSEDKSYGATNEMTYPNNPFGKSVAAGETKSLSIIFVVEEEVAQAETDWRLLLYYSAPPVGGDQEEDILIFEF